MILDNNLIITEKDILEKFEKAKKDIRKFEKAKEKASNKHEAKEDLDEVKIRVQKAFNNMSLSFWLPDGIVNKFLEEGKTKDISIVRNNFNDFKKSLADIFSSIIILIYNAVNFNESERVMDELTIAINFINTSLMKEFLSKNMNDKMVNDILKNLVAREEEE